MNKHIERLIATAWAEIGYMEKATTSDLDDPKANAGASNYTKYARDLDALGCYNGKKQGYAWCDVFVDWCFVQTFGDTLAHDMTFQPVGGYGAGCTASAGYYKTKGRFFTSNPQPGDQIFFTKDGGKSCYHTGLVAKVEGGKVYTVEGNTSAADGVVDNGVCVRDKSYALTYARIAGYGRPDFSLVPDEEETEEGGATMKVYHTLNDIPKVYRPTIQKLMEKKALGGFSDPDPTRLDDNLLNLTEDFCRVMTVLDRLGVLYK